MRPTVVILGFVLGSAAAITFALAGTTVVFIALRSEYPRLDAEFGQLLVSVGLFFLLTIVAGSSFYGELKVKPWRRIALAGLLATLAVVAVYHAWPSLSGYLAFALPADAFPGGAAVESAGVVGIEAVVARFV